jgi:adenosylmethionine-8-amino-7-oxononanoate aminotransferase
MDIPTERENRVTTGDMDENGRTTVAAGAEESPADKILYYAFGRRNPRVQRAEGYYYFDTEGNRYLDASSGAFNCVLGHTVPARIAAVLRAQASKLNFSNMSHFQNDAADRLVERMLALMPDYAAMGFFQSGSDAVEAAVRCALKVAAHRHGPARCKVISRRGDYHGATMGALALWGTEITCRQHFPNFLATEAQDCLSCPFDLKYPQCELQCAATLRGLIEREGPDTIAAFIGTPSARGGPVPDEYWPQVRGICHEYDIALISDEVLEGMWRTGPASALQRWGVTPDIVATGKALGAGFVPIFATLLTAEARDTLAEGGPFHCGHTFSGHILSCEVAGAVLDEIQARRLSSVGVEFVGRRLDALMRRVCERVEGARAGSLGALAHLWLPCTVNADRHAFYLQSQKHLQSAGLHAWIGQVRQSEIEVYLAPPYIADEEFFHELDGALGRFTERLPRRA